MKKKISIIIQDNKIVFSNTLGDVSALNPIDGRLLWQTPTQNKSVYEDAMFLKISDFLGFCYLLLLVLLYQYLVHVY